MTSQQEEPLHPEVVETPESVDEAGEESFVTHPTKLIRIASMTRAMLDEVRQAPLDDAGRRRLLDIHSGRLRNSKECCRKISGRSSTTSSFPLPAKHRANQSYG